MTPFFPDAIAEHLLFATVFSRLSRPVWGIIIMSAPVVGRDSLSVVGKSTSTSTSIGEPASRLAARRGSTSGIVPAVPDHRRGQSRVTERMKRGIPVGNTVGGSSPLLSHVRRNIRCLAQAQRFCTHTVRKLGKSGEKEGKTCQKISQYLRCHLRVHWSYYMNRYTEEYKFLDEKWL